MVTQAQAETETPVTEAPDTEAPEKESSKPKVEVARKYIIDRQGKPFVLFPGLLNAAHEIGIKEIETELVRLEPYSGKKSGLLAVVKAKVELEDGSVFSGIGDAHPDNVGNNIAPHTIRMAETRAKARALRDALNIVESVDETDDAPEDSNKPRQNRNSGSNQQGQNRQQKAQQANGGKKGVERRPGGYCTEEQANRLKEISEIAYGSVTEMLQEHTEVDRIGKLSYEQAGELIPLIETIAESEE